MLTLTLALSLTQNHPLYSSADTNADRISENCPPVGSFQFCILVYHKQSSNSPFGYHCSCFEWNILYPK